MNKFKNWLSLNPRLSLIIPYVLIAIIFILLPMLLIVISAFNYNPNNSDFDRWSIVKSSGFWTKAWRSIWVGLVTAIIALVIALPYAYFITHTDSKIFQIAAMSLIVSPILIFTVARVFSLRYVMILTFHMKPENFNGEMLMIIGNVYLNLPFMIMPLFTVFKNMPNSMIEASQDLGHSKFATFFKVILPYGLKAIISGIILIFISSATSFIISNKLLSNGANYQTVGNIINDTSQATSSDLAISSATVIVVTIIIFGICAIINFAPKIIMKLKGMKYE